MAVAHVDDSGSEPSQPVLVLAGFVSTARRWEKLASDWQGVLQRYHRIAYFKMAEANARRGQFQGMRVTYRDAKVSSLASLTKPNVACRIGVTLPWRGFKPNFKAPHGYSGRRIMDQAKS